MSESQEATTQVPPADDGTAGAASTTTTDTGDQTAGTESISQAVAQPQLGSVEAAQADLAANPGRTSSLSEAGHVVRD